jgi:hypothetical protein
MAVQTIYILGTTAVGPNWFGNTQLNGSAPAAATTAFGWVPAKTATSTPYFRSRLGATAPASDAGSSLDPVGSVNAPTPGTGSGAATAGDCFIAGPFTGTFANSTWTFNWNLRASIAGCVGLVGMKIYRSVNVNGSPASQVKAESGGTTVTLSTTADTNSQIVWNPGATVTLNNEYLFFQLMWQETTQGSTNGCNVLFRTGTSFITTPDFVYTPQTVQASALIADPVLNWIRNSRAEGAIAGTPGTNPTYWWGNVPTGLTRTIVGSGVENGIPYVDIRWNGTQTAAGAQANQVGFENGAFVIPGRVGQQAVFSFYQKLVGGSVANVDGWYQVVQEYDAAGTALSNTNYRNPPAPPSTSLDLNRTSYVVTPTNATCAWVMPQFYFQTSQNDVIDITIRFGGPQYELNATLSPLALSWPGSLLPARASGSGINTNAVRGPVAASALIAGTGGAPVNYLPNPRAQGAVVGTPGTMPPYWAYYATNGVTTSVAGGGVLPDGTPYVDLRYNGTPTGTYIVGVFNNTVPVSSGGGVPWTGSAYVAMVGGSMANIASVDVELRNSIGIPFATFTPTATLTRYSVTTTTSGYMYGQTFGWGLSITAGLPIDITLRFALPQLEIGTVPTAPILPIVLFAASGQPRGIFANASGGRDVSPNRFTLNFSPGGPRQDYTGDVGVQFTPAVALTFNRIGIRCPIGGTGIHTLKIRDVTGNAVLQSVTIDLTGATPGAYYYTALPQTTLTAGNIYYLATNVTGNDGQLWPDHGPTMLRGVAVGSVSDGFSGGSANPNNDTAEHQYYGLDLDLVTTPAVANATIAGLGGWTNYVHNPRAEGAVVGTPGTLPTYWGNTLSDAGLAQQIVATGTDATSGLGYVDIRIFGTPSASSTFFIMLDAFDVSLAPGDRFTVTEWLAVVGGSVTNLANVIVVAYYNPVVDSIGAGDVRTLLTATLTPYGGTGIARNDVTSLGAPRLQIGYTASQPIDVTFRIAGPQLERGSVRTLPIYPPAGAPNYSTRALLAAPGVAINASARIDGSGGTTNWIRNPRAEGAVAGTPGTLPTFWMWAGNGPTPFTQQVVSTGIDAATRLSYVDVRVFGTAPGSGNIFLFTEPNYWQITAAGDTFTTTLWLALVAGSLTNINFSVVSNFANAGGNIAVAVSPSITATLTPYGATNAAPAGNIYTSGVFIAFGYFAGAVDITLRIAAPQLERGSVRTPIILPPVGAPQVTTRGLIATPTPFTPTGATINGTGGVRASIAPVAVLTGAVIAGGEANYADRNQTPRLADPNTCVVSTDILPPSFAGNALVFKHVRNGTTGDANTGYVNNVAVPPVVPYTHSVMVWVPAGWTGTSIQFLAAAQDGPNGVVNLSLTNQWQKVSAQALTYNNPFAILYVNDAGASPFYTSLWTYTPDTVVAAPTIFGSTALGGVGSVTASAYTLAQTATTIAGQGGRTNWIRNPRAEGAVVPNALPYNWAAYLDPGLALQVVGTGIEGGLSYVDVRIYGTAAGAPNGLAMQLFTDGGNPIVASAGQTWTHSVYVRLVGGAIPNAFQVLTYLENAAYGIITFSFTSPQSFAPTNGPLATQRLVTSGTISDPTARYVVANMWLYYGPTGQVVDCTLRIASPQLESGPLTGRILPPIGVYQYASTRALEADAGVFIPTGAQIDGRGGQTNYIRNPRVEGAVVGTPGTLPTYWVVNITPGILTQQVVATGTDAASGLAWVDLRFFGTPTSTSGFTIYMDPIIYNGAPGDTLTNTIWMALSGGSTTNITGLYFTTQYQPGGNGNFGPTIIPGITSTLTPYSANWGYLPVAAPAFNGGYIFITWAAGPVDITLRIAATQLERGTVATPIIYPPVGAPQASTRALLAMPRVPGLAQATIGGTGSVSATASALRPAAAPVGGRNGTTNYVLNPRWVGAALGTVAVGPVQSPPMPTGWTCWSDTVTTTIVGIGTEDGLDYIDVRLAGTTTNTLWGLNPIHFDGPTTRGDVWTVSFHLSVQSGDTSQMQWRIETQELDANGGYVTATANNRSVFPTGKLISTRASETYTISNSATRYSLPTFFLMFAAGQAIDITIRLACMQSELGPVATPLILPPPGVMAIASRALLAMPTTLALPQQIIAGQGGKTNFITNPRGDGAAIGTPGTPPANWSYGTRLAGLSTAIVGTGTEAGVPYVDIRWFGTSTDIVTGVSFSGLQEIASYWLEPWVLSAYLKVIAGDSSQIVFNMNTQAISANGVYLTEYYNAVVPAGSNTPLDQARLSTMTAYAAGVNLAFVRPVVLLRFATELAVDVTLRIGAPQLEIRSLSSVMMPPPIFGLFGLRTSRGVEALPTQIVQAAAQINGEGLIHAESTFVGQARANATLAGVGNIIITGLRQRHAAHATIHGTGSVIVGFAAKEAIKARLLGVGGVQATAAIAHPTIARIRGVGGVGAVSQRVRYASATIAGNSRLFATAFPAKSGNVTIAGAGLLRVRDAIVAVVQMAAATIAGDAAVHVQGRRAPPCDGLIEAEGNVYATAIVQAAGQALVAGAGTVDAHGTAWRHAEALLDGEGEVRGLLNHRPVASAGIGGVGQVAADGTPVRQTYGVSALIAGVGRVRADAFRAATVAAEALITGLGAVLAIGLRAAVVNVDKTIAGVGNVRATVSRVIVAAGATIAGTGNLRTNATQIGAHNAEAQIDGSSWLRVDSVTVTQVQAAATIQGAGGAVARGARAHPARATITGAGGVAARGSVWAPALAMIAGAGALVAGHRKAPFPVYARAGGEGSVSAVATVMVAAHVRIAGHADMADVAATLHAEAQVRISVHGWLIERAKSQLEAHARIAGEGDLAFDGEQMSHRHTSAVIRGIGHIETDAGTPREQIAAQGVFLPPSLVGVSVL